MDYHPDRNHGFKKEAEEKMKELNNARDYILKHFDEYKNLGTSQSFEDEKEDIFEDEENVNYEDNYKSKFNNTDKKFRSKMWRFIKVLYFIITLPIVLV
jgi:DnaJ-class molecular chaperone